MEHPIFTALGSRNDWIGKFRSDSGRPPRLLHIGNIANNAYLNAKILRKAGMDCDVLCYDYYHIMGCPEWEEADFDSKVDEFFPDWDRVDLQNFSRPRWFVQGPLQACFRYLISQRDESAWRMLNHSAFIRTSQSKAIRRIRVPGLKRLISLIRRIGSSGIKALDATAKSKPFEARARVMIDQFARLFGEREDRLTLDDLRGYRSTSQAWSHLFQRYDAVIGYSTDGQWPLIAEKKPYFAYEHGTIRQIPFEATTQGRLCALTYRLADTAFITNCDNIAAAGKLGLSNYQFIPHPVNEDIHVDKRADELRKELRARLDSDFIVFHPARQHWESCRHPNWEKGNDIFISGLARFIREVNPKAAAVLVEWGKMVGNSRKLIEELGIDGRVLWIPPQPNARMVRYIGASDLVADQFYLGAFGSIMPKALLHRCPSMLYLDENRHQWCFPEMPPVVNARNPEEVLAGLTRLYKDPAYRADLIRRGRDWYTKYHSNRVIADTFTLALSKALRPRSTSGVIR